MTDSWPVVLVTGANGGLGFGICKRLLVQISSKQPSDALPQSFVTQLPSQDSDSDSGITIPYYDGLTIIMACRSQKRAEKAREELLLFLAEHIRKMRVEGKDVEHAELVKKNVKIEIEQIDLADLRTVFNCVERIQKKYTYISHLILNAGVADFTGINWLKCIKQVLTEFRTSLTMPCYNNQYIGRLSVDGLGWVFQSNIFGHFVLVRMLEPQLLASAHQSQPHTPLAPRVIWMSSMEALPNFFDINDWQLLKVHRSYETVKYEIDLIATYLDQQAVLRAGREQERVSSRLGLGLGLGLGRGDGMETELRHEPVIRHFVAQPGICSTSVAVNLAGPWLSVLKDFLFYVARWLGSPHHAIDAYKAAISTTHLVLVPLSFITFFIASPSSKLSDYTNGTANGHTPSASPALSRSSSLSRSQNQNHDLPPNHIAHTHPHAHIQPRGQHIRPPSRFGTETDFWGVERVGLTPVREWESEKRQREARELVGRCDALLEEMLRRRDRDRAVLQGEGEGEV